MLLASASQARWCGVAGRAEDEGGFLGQPYGRSVAQGSDRERGLQQIVIMIADLNLELSPSPMILSLSLVGSEASAGPTYTSARI